MNSQNNKINSNTSFVHTLNRFIYSLIKHFLLRTKQVAYYLWSSCIFIGELLATLKENVVRRMFWGRSTFYRSAFQFSVGLMTIILSIGGLAGRLNLFSVKGFDELLFPTEGIGDADYLDEGASIQAIVTNASLTRGFEVQKYIVQNGDNLDSIAVKFSISKDTIIWANGLLNEDYLKVGQELDILPINGVKHTIAEGDSLESLSEKYSSSVQDIYDINWLESSDLIIGQELLIPNGSIEPEDEDESYSGILGFVRPTVCGRITNWFSAWHGGVDIAQAGGCNIIAVDGGTVTMARWYGAGGLQIMIDHGNGFVSLYAHNSAIYVKEGQRVEKGQVISYMGSTGRSTGTHLHFGLQKGGIWINPLVYVPI